MNWKSNFSASNGIFIVGGGGGIKYYRNCNCNRTLAYVGHVWRATLILLHVYQLYTVNNWVMANESKIFEPMSLVMIISMEMKIIAPILSIAWRAFYDDRLSAILVALDDTHERLTRLNATGPPPRKICLVFVGVTVHYAVHMIRPLDITMNVPSLSVPEMAVVIIGEMCQSIGFYEYLLLLSRVQWTVRAINELTRKNGTPVGALGRTQAHVLECVRDANHSIFGTPVLLNFIGCCLADMVIVTYYHLLFRGMFFKYKKNLYVAIVNVALKLFDICLLYAVCSCVTKEINRTSMVLHERSVTETNSKFHREIQYFSLRTTHDKFEFELCGIYKISIKELIILLAKAITFIIIQIQFKLNTIGKTFS